MRDYLSEEARIVHIIKMVEEYQGKQPGALLTHAFVQRLVEQRYQVSGTLIRKYARHAIMRGLLAELRPSYDGSIGGIQIVTGNPAYIACVETDRYYRLASEQDDQAQPRQLALIGTPERMESVLRRFTPLGLLPEPDCG